MKIAILVSSLLGFGSLSASVALAKDRHRIGVEIKSPLKGVNFQRIKAFREAAPDEVSGRVQALKPFRIKIDGRNAATALGAAQPRGLSAAYQNITALSPYGTQYAVEVTWDGQPVNMILDTGSSDTWVTASNFTCTNLAGTAAYSQEACGFGPSKIDGFKYGPAEDLHFTLSYGSGERVSGPMGFSDIGVAGITVQQQQVGLANKTYWMGNNYTNGILGLAFSSLTSAFMGDMDEDRPAFQVPYSPFFTSMVQQGLSADSFSVSLVRNSSGLVAWGGRTGLPVDGPTAYTSLIIRKTTINPHRPTGSWQYSYYTVLVDGIRWGSTSDTRRFLYLVDTGTTLMYVPPPIAEAIARSFSPSAVYLFQYGGYFAPCHAIAPKIAVVIEGASFFINPVDLIYPGLVDPLTGYCQIGITTGGTGPYILGTVFLHNVEAYFDVGAGQMRFYGRDTFGPTPQLPEK
ncbi:eukaryotic aspartyl protease [Colletotrichum navitas]|uniref:Eukaryotic aspartyl protease n=1 Tax=Colletotrichum navitas TaxID=681940 RepID=A0AAD8Q8J7_9PEZI|nr:eukaryotic aspartyl protease [Colletotrichum navitas]KAK1597549.1 eukaryotic aspartyl protease [Colletotrichum navitas]